MRDLPGAFDRLLTEMTPSVRQAFLDAIGNIRTAARLRDIEAMLDGGNIEGLLDALNLSPEYFAPVADAVDAAFHTGAGYQVSLTASLSSVPFNRRHWAAERWVKDNGGRLVAEIAEATREGVRAYVEESIRTGRGSNATAREIVGRINRASGRREGGILGLTGQEAGYVANARAELEGLSPDYLKRVARDRRYDRLVRKAIREGKPLGKADIDRIIGRYSDGLLIRRGDRIARTEAHTALSAGRYEAAKQTAEHIGLTEAAISVRWHSARDERVRSSHRAMNGQVVRHGEPFTSPSGARMRFPGDTSLGAGPSETIGCRCVASYVFGNEG